MAGEGLARLTYPAPTARRFAGLPAFADCTEVASMSVLRNCLLAARKVVLGVAVVGLLGGAGWGIWHWRAGAERQVRFRTEKVTRGRVAALINASGTVVPEEVVDVGAQVAGKILAFGADLDESRKTIDYRSRVEEGTVLVRIDDSLYAPEVGIARAEVAVAEADILRCKADLDAARARLQQATRDMQRAKRA